MSPIKHIIDTETEARELIIGAKEKAEAIHSEAIEKQKKTLEKHQISVKEHRNQLMAEHKVELKKLYKDILAVGQAEEIKVKDKAKKNEQQAVALILSNI